VYGLNATDIEWPKALRSSPPGFKERPFGTWGASACGGFKA